MCITPVSPETSARARASSAPVSCSENSPAALSTCPPRVPPPSASCWASPRSSVRPGVEGARRLEVALRHRNARAVDVELRRDEQRAGELALAVARPMAAHQQPQRGAAHAAVQVEAVRGPERPQPAGELTDRLGPPPAPPLADRAGVPGA